MRNEYINNKNFVKALVDYQKACRVASRNKEKEPEIPRYIGECIIWLCTQMATRKNWSGYSYNDEFVGDAIERCVYAVRKFNPKFLNTRGTVNAFGYLSRVAWNAMCKRLLDEKEQNYIKYKNYQNSVLDAGTEWEHVPENDDVGDRIIGDFEDKRKKKASKATPVVVTKTKRLTKRPDKAKVKLKSKKSKR